MKHVDEYRDTESCRSLIDRIGRVVTKPRTIMEVCGGQTHGLLANGIDEALRSSVRLLHGPGCPVCVTPETIIDAAIELSLRPNVLVTSFGDMLRVPGTSESLQQCRARGGKVQLVYSPLDALKLARQQPEFQVIFLAVGFETTAPTTALAVRQAEQLGVPNFSLLVGHVRVRPAMELIMQSPDCQVEGFLAAGHVCTVTGYESYREFARRFQVPVVITGFEPVDLLSGILECVQRIESGRADVVNCYQRSVRPGGNITAVQLMSEVYEECDQVWRGIGSIPLGGFRLRPQYSEFDAMQRFLLTIGASRETCPTRCRAGEVLTGRLSPPECEYFGRECTPLMPLGAPMVSSEGACAAYFRRASQRPESEKATP